ncbi:MAG: ORF6N domain-containing protein [Proteobacteria bacterium]|nr:ORF6N domain-containing protein [Pseudomonadota bacterium]MBU2227576.1 ORF6N domain-containing protein [Pseudomonadota bacterium]MBU2261053.1 ORF6N domain-containing protein [Pseudomonadota bacterium]
MADKKSIVPAQQIESLILIKRGQRVMLDADLAALYGVPTKRFNEQVKRNIDRFPEDFMFQLTQQEKAEVVANCDHLGRLKFSPVLPYAFTEHGAIMAANVLKSERAVKVSIQVVRAFVKLREMLATHKEMAGKLTELEKRLDSHDQDIRNLVVAIRQLMTPPSKPRRQIGFKEDAHGRSDQGRTGRSGEAETSRRTQQKRR